MQLAEMRQIRESCYVSRIIRQQRITFFSVVPYLLTCPHTITCTSYSGSPLWCSGCSHYALTEHSLEMECREKRSDWKKWIIVMILTVRCSVGRINVQWPTAAEWTLCNRRCAGVFLHLSVRLCLALRVTRVRGTSTVAVSLLIKVIIVEKGGAETWETITERGLSEENKNRGPPRELSTRIRKEYLRTGCMYAPYQQFCISDIWPHMFLGYTLTHFLWIYMFEKKKKSAALA